MADLRNISEFYAHNKYKYIQRCHGKEIVKTQVILNPRYCKKFLSFSYKKYSQSTVNALVEYEEFLLFGEVRRVSEKKKKKPEKKKNCISSPRRALGVRRKKNQTQGFDICVSLETQKYDRLYGAPTILCLIYQVFVKFEKNVPLRVIYFISTVTGSSPQAISKAPSTVSVFILKIKCSSNVLVSYVCFDICGGIERALSRGHPARMQFPQTLCPLCDKQVIRRCNSGFISFIFSKFSQNCLSHAKQLFLYKYGFRPHVSDENDH